MDLILFKIWILVTKKSCKLILIMLTFSAAICEFYPCEDLANFDIWLNLNILTLLLNLIKAFLSRWPHLNLNSLLVKRQVDNPSPHMFLTKPT